MPTISEIKNIYHVIAGKNAEKIELLKSGFSNHSYLINRDHVLRIKKASRDKFYNSKLEALVINKIAPLKISETAVYFNEKDGTKLSLYLKRTKKIMSQPTNEQMAYVAKALKKLHRAKIVTGVSFDIINRLQYYKSRCIDYVDTLYERKVILAVERFFYQEPFVLCHNDVVNGNLLFRKRQVFLIDFEYAADNNPLFDLASFISENDIVDDKSRRYFLRQYYGKSIDEKQFRRLLRLIELQDILWYYWAQMHYVQTKESIYKRIAHHKWKAIIKNASSH